MRKIGEAKYKVATVILACALVLTVALSLYMMQNYSNLSNDVKSVDETLLSYCSFPEAFPRVINTNTIDEINSTVLSVTGNAKDLSMLPYQKIYDYVATNIQGANDIEMPYISSTNSYDFLWSQYYTKLQMATIPNYIQSPELTLELKQGSCHDQAVLTFAMMKCYMHLVLRTDDELFIATVHLADGTAHAMVIYPGGHGTLSIIDPAVRYLTTSNGTMTFKDANTELNNYNSFWQSQFSTSITYFTLYEVNAKDGSCSFIDQGTINQIQYIF